MNLHIDVRRREARVDDNLLRLSPGEFRLLIRLAHDPGAIVTSEHLYEAMVGVPCDGSQSALQQVRVYISRLRKQIGRHAIEMVFGVGYRLAHDVAVTRTGHIPIEAERDRMRARAIEAEAEVTRLLEAIGTAMTHLRAHDRISAMDALASVYQLRRKEHVA